MKKRVFLSYSSDAATYIEEFAPLFRPPAGNPEVYFYGDDPAVGGVLQEELKDEILKASVFLCFLNRAYPNSKSCINEFDFASHLQVQSGGLQSETRFFVPVILDSEGKEFWKDSVSPNKSAEWASALLYTDLTDKRTGTRPMPIHVNGTLNATAFNLIQRLGQKVKKKMNW
jgi:hypothetical protein